jgi:glyoxylase-like metal-dependent hydrolase (beta-lactamase superfamily II)
MQVYPIETGNFKLDGGAMFGVVPKVIWQKTNPSDANNLIDMSLRCMLIEDGNKLILIDNGTGHKQSEKFFSYYFPFGDENLDSSLKKFGFHRNDITDVFLTHLHFDHCGGAINNNNGEIETAFKNARYWTNKDHWQWAVAPNGREKASFLKENIIPIEESGQLNWVDIEKTNWDLFEVMTVDGHTEKQMLPKIQFKGKTLVFVADLLPSTGHLPLPYVMSYDVRPLVTLQEKDAFLRQAADEEYILFFEHDPVVECCTVKHTERGVRLDQVFKLTDI